MKTNGTLLLITLHIFSWFDSLAGVGERKKTPITHEKSLQEINLNQQSKNGVAENRLE